MGNKLEQQLSVENWVMWCPKGHEISYNSLNIRKCYIGKNADCLAIFQDGLYCGWCDRSYEFSKLSKEEPVIEE